MRGYWPALWIVLCSTVVAGCGGNAQGHDTSTIFAPRQLIVALDLSGSQSEARRNAARQALDRAIEGLGYGDRVVLLQVHQRAAAEDNAIRWAETAPLPPDGRAPTSLDRERLEAVKKAAHAVARSIFENEAAGRIPTTDLLATLHIAAEYVRDSGQRPTSLLLLSDMLQSAHGIEMSRPGGVPSADWLAQQQAAGLVPGLDGVCVSVVGADATTPNGLSVRTFWLRYFAMAGATLEERNYRLIATDASALTC
jgi:hypothetical protein